MVISLEADYALLYKILKGRHYADFQMKWLEHVRHVAEYEYALATMDAQVVNQDDVYLYSSESFGKCENYKEIAKCFSCEVLGTS